MDEPTTSLDVTTEAVVLDLIRELLEEFQTAVLYITHNLGVIARICHRVGVMYAGQLVEEDDSAGVQTELVPLYDRSPRLRPAHRQQGAGHSIGHDPWLHSTAGGIAIGLHLRSAMSYGGGFCASR